MNFRSLSLAALAFLGCADVSRGQSADEPDASTVDQADASGVDVGNEALNPRPLLFDVLHPLILAGCKDCHQSGGQAANTTLLFTGNDSGDLAALLPYVDRDTPTASRAWAKATGRNHGGGTVWPAGSKQADTLLAWIQQGAQP